MDGFHLAAGRAGAAGPCGPQGRAGHLRRRRLRRAARPAARPAARATRWSTRRGSTGTWRSRSPARSACAGGRAAGGRRGQLPAVTTAPGGPASRALLDECWFLDLDDAVRVERLIARHVAHGRTPEAAREWVLRSDEANARLVARRSGPRHGSWCRGRDCDRWEDVRREATPPAPSSISPPSARNVAALNERAGRLPCMAVVKADALRPRTGPGRAGGARRRRDMARRRAAGRGARAARGGGHRPLLVLAVRTRRPVHRRARARASTCRSARRGRSTEIVDAARRDRPHGPRAPEGRHRAGPQRRDCPSS